MPGEAHPFDRGREDIPIHSLTITVNVALAAAGNQSTIAKEGLPETFRFPVPPAAPVAANPTLLPASDRRRKPQVSCAFARQP
jgi:hypothetical protein